MLMKYIMGLSISLFLIISTAAFAKSNVSFSLHGLQGDVKTNVNNRLLTLQSHYSNRLTPGLTHTVYLQGIHEVKQGVEPYGYFKSRIESRLIRQGDKWIANYYVTLGEPIRITHISVTITGPGKDNPIINKYIQNLPLKTNDVFTAPSYDTVKNKLFSKARNQGYLHAFYKNDIIVDLKSYTCHINMQLETGQQFYFGNITFVNHPYSQDFLNRFINLEPGDIFSSKKIINLQQAMEKSYYFTRAIVTPDFEATSPDRRIPLKFELFPPKARRYSLGIGYGTLTGARISGSMSLRHLGNEGNHLEAEMKLSSILSGLGATYYIPGKNPLTDTWLIGLNAKRFQPKAGNSNSVTFSAGYSKKSERWQTSINLNMLTERFKIHGLPDERSHLLYPSWKTSYIVADNLMSPRNAYAVNLTVQGGSQHILSSTSFAQIQTRAKAIFSPVSFARILLRAELGFTDVHHLAVFPLSMRYFAGGVTSIRGFADSSIGPGKYLGVASIEYQNRIKGDLFGAVFYDAGYASNHLGKPLNRGVGIGAVYDTRIGPIKLYVARAISKHTKPFSVDFSIGAEFS
jgi:translocation and assembly module TamA